MPKVLTFIDAGKSQELYRDTLQSLMTQVVEIPGDELSFEYWPGLEGATAIIRDSKPDLTFICGEQALNQMFRIKGIRRSSGKMMDWDGNPVVPLFSPGYISSHSSELGPYAESIQKAYMIAAGEEFLAPENEFVIIKSLKELLPYLPYLSVASWVSFDYETTTLKDMATFDPDFRLRGLALTYQIGSAIFLDLENMSPDEVRHVAMALEEKVFNNPDIVKIGHNVKFDMHCAAKMGVTKFKGPYHCTMLMAHLLDQNTPNGLKYLVGVHLPAFAGYEDVLQGSRWEDIPIETLARYAALDSDLTLRLYLHFTNIMLEKDKRVYNLFRNVTVPATMALFQAEQNGMLVDSDYLEAAMETCRVTISEQEDKLRTNSQVQNFQTHKNKVLAIKAAERIKEKIEKEEAREYKTKPAMQNSLARIEQYKVNLKALERGKVKLVEPINFGSHVQMNELIYGKNGFGFSPPKDPITEQYKTGTGKDVLAYIHDRTGFLDDLLAFRQLQKILSTYLLSIWNKRDANSKIHTNFNQHGTITGRLSSDKPNMQNIISRTKFKVVEETVKLVKNSFSVPKGYTLIQADYSQAELRLIAHYSQDKAMMKAYLADQDLHELTAANAKSLKLDQWRELPEKEKKQSRFEAKSENFGLIYGMSAGGYRNYARVQYGIVMGQRKAQERRDSFFKNYPSLTTYHTTYKARGYKFGYVRTMFGRKVYIPDLKSFNRIKVGHAERNAINSPIQGTAGEMTIFAFALLAPLLDKRVIFVNTIHDSILYYVPDDILDETILLIKTVMENLPIETYFEKTLSLPMKADFELSKKSWGQLEPYV